MKITTLCYVEQNEQYLMLHRIKKKQDPNEGKWIGVGGKLEEKESPEECLLREVKEETGLTLLDYQYHGLITFVSDTWETEYMHLYTSTKFEGTLKECDEGHLQWVDKKKILDLNLWEGDKIFLRLLLDKKIEKQSFFSLKLVYKGQELENANLKIF